MSDEPLQDNWSVGLKLICLLCCAMSGLVHKVKIIHGLCLLHLEISFLNMSEPRQTDAQETANSSFPGITHISGKDFQLLLAVKEGEI